MKNNNLAVRPQFSVEMPAEALPLGFDTDAEKFSWMDVYPSNYWTVEALLGRIELLGGNPVYTPAEIRLQAVIDPEDRDPDLSPKLVMYFDENVPALVLNRTRCAILTRATGTPDPRRWVALCHQVELSVGVARDYSQIQQILIAPIISQPKPQPPPKPQPKGGNGRYATNRRATEDLVDSLNDDLFS